MATNIGAITIELSDKERRWAKWMNDRMKREINDGDMLELRERVQLARERLAEARSKITSIDDVATVYHADGSAWVEAGILTPDQIKRLYEASSIHR